MTESRGYERKGRALVGVVGFMASLVLIWTASQDYPIGTWERPGAATFPIIVGIGWLLASALVIWESRRADLNVEKVELTRSDVVKAGLILVAFIGYVALLPVLGFILATAIFFALVLRTLTSLALWRIAAAGLTTALAFYGLFVALFGLPMPAGVLGFG